MFGFFKKSKGSAVDGFAKRRPFATTMLCLGALGLSLGGLTTGIVLGTKKGDDAFTTPYDESTTTVIGEIWKGTYFDPTNFNNLLSAISNGKASSENMTYIETAAMTTLDGAKIAGATAEKMRQNNQEGKEIIVMIDGLNWTPTYLSVDKDGNTILTLWLSDSEQLSEKVIFDTTTFNSIASTRYSYRWDDFVINETYVPGMYGTSYIRSVVLNNGGIYATSATESINYQQDSASAFAKFTIKDIPDSLTEYIVTPEKVQWQEYGQNAISQLNLSNSLANENWSDNIPNSGVYMGENYNFAQASDTKEFINYTKHKEDNNRWKYDKLWLPSLTETGYDSSHIGIWDTSTTQRKTSDPYYYFWLRSGGRSGWHAQEAQTDAINLDPYVYFAGCVRPAFHLNLTLASQHAHIPTWVDFATDKFANEDDVNGESEETAYEIATAEQLALLAKRVNDPNTHDDYASKFYKQTSDIRLGGHDWQPIGQYGTAFQGCFDGAGHKIEGVTINDGNEVGLFSNVEDNGTIENVNLENGVIDTIDGWPGSIAACLYGGSSKILNCRSNVNVTGSDAGGIAGYVEEGIVSGCYYSGTVKTVGESSEYCGGIVGDLYQGTLTNSIFDGVVNGIGSVGGLVGGTENTSSKVSNCISKGIVINGSSLCGSFPYSSISNCAAYGYINTDYPDSTGALISYASGTTITGCSFCGTCNTDDIAPFVADYGVEYGGEMPTITACYVWLNNDIKVYSDDTADWGSYYGLAGTFNDGLPMQRSLFAIASVSPARTPEILAVFSPDNGWEKYTAA